jgi:hypothetical protein
VEYSQNTFVTTIEQFMKLVDYRKHGTTLGRGWGTFEVHCPLCGGDWKEIRVVGTKGVQCPWCRAKGNDYLFLGMIGEMPNEGCWLEPVGWEYSRISHN